MAGSPRRAAGRRLQLPLLCLLLQGATAILFAVFLRYDPETDAALWHWGNHSNADNEFYFRYPTFRDVRAVAFAGSPLPRAAFALQRSALRGLLRSSHRGHVRVGVESLDSVFPLVAASQCTATSQAMHQLFGLFVTLTFASVGGGLAGLLLRLPFLGSPPDSQCYDDQVYWEVPGEREEEAQGLLRAEEPDTQA